MSDAGFADKKRERCRKRVRAYVAGKPVIDTVRADLVWHVPHYPQFHVPKADVRWDDIPQAAREASKDDGEYVYFKWATLDAWFEEDEEVFVHPHDPNKRIDILVSSRHVVVQSDGVTLAETRRPTMLFETGAIVRTYFPKADVRLDLLEATSLRTGCAYKGWPSYWKKKDGDREIAWCYQTPFPEAQKIAGMIAFYDERVDVIVDGVKTATST